MRKGIIFNIQKFSTNDGPGVRTTVFFKGCPLTCKWCANPESQSSSAQILYDQSRCTHCLTCVHTCPQRAISLTDNGFSIKPGKCKGCLQCVSGCPSEALNYEGEHKAVQEIVDVCLQDKDFYETSGGGVTISGGEGMSQPEFLEELVLALKQHKIHLAIETTGYTKPEIFKFHASAFFRFHSGECPYAPAEGPPCSNPSLHAGVNRDPSARFLSHCHSSIRYKAPNPVGSATSLVISA